MNETFIQKREDCIEQIAKKFVEECRGDRKQLLRLRKSFLVSYDVNLRSKIISKWYNWVVKQKTKRKFLLNL